MEGRGAGTPPSADCVSSNNGHRSDNGCGFSKKKRRKLLAPRLAAFNIVGHTPGVQPK